LKPFDPNAPKPRNPGSGLRLGYLSEAGEYKVVQDLYYHDKVIEAYDECLAMGAIAGGATLGFYRLVEGEALTRRVSVITDVTPWLKLEVPADGPDAAKLGELARDTCMEVGGRLGWNYEAQVLVTVLVADADVPWNGARYGYMMDKYPYDKVCLPWTVLQHQGHFHEVLAHEFAHVVTLNLSLNRAPHWVEEGISTLVEGPLDERILKRFRSGTSPWRDPRELEAAFFAERRNGENREKITDAYDQARLLLEFLSRAKGEDGIRRFLRSFSDHSVWDEIKLRLGKEPVEEALQAVYGLSVADLFAQAKTILS
jgi:hypothetical protein